MVRINTCPYLTLYLNCVEGAFR